MGRSSLLGIDRAPLEPKGRDEEALGPGDNSDSGSDRAGTDSLPSADPAEPVDVTLGRDLAHAPLETREPRAQEDGADISVDQIFDDEELPGVDKAEAIDRAMAPDPGDEEEGEEDDEDEDEDRLRPTGKKGRTTNTKPRARRGD
ncbi:hypothetical protein [Roseateles violae]|uniref:Uncharacterized protein n=1 Tax=Roseateles violae TaxID=3058042 RepID=A0ABT8DW29_9BURK|nr:hypothetical protein [Pelomonas sp. PFR6]MDN3921094.1 hypothetical protein [Pelomonas sp. PFR6]